MVAVQYTFISRGAPTQRGILVEESDETKTRSNTRSGFGALLLARWSADASLRAGLKLKPRGALSLSSWRRAQPWRYLTTVCRRQVDDPDRNATATTTGTEPYMYGWILASISIVQFGFYSMILFFRNGQSPGLCIFYDSMRLLSDLTKRIRIIMCRNNKFRLGNCMYARWQPSTRHHKEMVTCRSVWLDYLPRLVSLEKHDN